MALTQVGLERLNSATTKKIGKNKNIIINGAMQVAQRGTSSTANGYGSVDRIYVGNSGVDEAPTHAQVDVASGTTPYTLGLRKALKITNGNQTSGAGAADYIYFNAQAIEAQNLANSGWNFKSSSSNITLSFYVKSSVAQNFYFQFDVRDGTRYSYAMETGSLTADTWTKVTKTIPGNSNLTIDNDNGIGAYITFGLFWGTNYTGSVSLDTWGVASDSAKTPNYTSTWYTTNDATFEITGVQLEVGSVATDFENKSFGEDLQLCSRYYQKQLSGSTKAVASAFAYNTTYGNFSPHYPMGPMRTAPSLDQTNGDNYYEINGGLDHGDHLDGAFVIEHGTETTCNIYFDPDGALNNGYSFYLRSDNASAYLAYSAEL